MGPVDKGRGGQVWGKERWMKEELECWAGPPETQPSEF